MSDKYMENIGGRDSFLDGYVDWLAVDSLNLQQETCLEEIL
jgi:hypothetical protein